MRVIEISRLALCACALLLGAGAQAAGDRGAYEQVKAAAKSAYDAASRQCDSLSGNGKDVCVAEAKAVRTKAEVDAEAAYKDTPKARQEAVAKTADANYTVAKERCNAKAGNDKDVCIKVAKAVMAKAKADAKATRKSTDAHVDAAKEKREADYSVAKEKCDALAGEAKSACVAQAKARYRM